MSNLRKDGIFRDEFVVPEAVIDGNGHVNNVAYVQWMQDVAIRHATALTRAGGMGNKMGTWVARSHYIEYLRPAFAGDRVQASTWIADLRRVRARRRYEFVRQSDGVMLAKGETDWVYINPESGRPCSIPEEIKAAFTLFPDTQEPRR
ncbi:acyl-CoA thioesterase [Candidatus Bipolaricaulota bacterium]|nr:acyl-CoA thioesterase [Candidatus Bipolaricaulota bacterium]